jgi:hypothetical protein
MGRTDYLIDRVKISRRVPTLNRGLVENDSDLDEGRVTVSDWIPARIRKIGGAEVQTQETKVDLPISYELVMLAKDKNGNPIRPQQHDRFIFEYARSTKDLDLPQYMSSSQKFRILGSIKEVRKRSRIYSYVIPVILDLEF